MSLPWEGRDARVRDLVAALSRPLASEEEPRLFARATDLCVCGHRHQGRCLECACEAWVPHPQPRTT